ncbi:hypothetical protein LJR251_002759 [Rhizobium rhizogenes]|uniref:hypothetical protein n=1 Tax=Rhizobium rhizogenes TaxID=359 RepID=UPI003ECFB071
MSTLSESLKKQNELLQGEVERFANAIDSLAAQLVDAQNQLKALQAMRAEMMPADTGVVIEADARKIGAHNVAKTTEKRLRTKR